jgi:hypothetical protein
MGRPLDLTGQRFGKLVALELVETGRRRKWLCACDCGGQSVVAADNLRTGNSTACGGCRTPSRGALKHGGRPQGQRSPTYSSWIAMRRRCNDPGRDNAKHYSARGISYDPRWEDFAAFLEDMGERPPGHTLDRINNDLGYSKENCRWATPTEQTRNRGIARTFTAEGRTLSLVEWARVLGVHYGTVVRHVDRHNRLPEPAGAPKFRRVEA